MPDPVFNGILESVFHSSTIHKSTLTRLTSRVTSARKSEARRPCALRRAFHESAFPCLLTSCFPSTITELKPLASCDCVELGAVCRLSSVALAQSRSRRTPPGTQDAAYFHDVRRRATRLYHFFSLLYFVKIRKNICAADNKHTYQEIKKEPRIVAQRIGVATSLSMHHCIRVPVSGSGSSLVGRPTMTTLDSVQHTPEAGLPTPASRPWKVLSRVLGWPARIGSSMRRSAAAVAEPAPARHSRRHLPPTS